MTGDCSHVNNNMTKERIPIDSELAANVLFASDETCCVCCNADRPVQIHHVDDNPANNNFENLAVLCLLCHDKTQIAGGFGRKLNAPLVRKHKTDWLQRVKNRRNGADELAIKTMWSQLIRSRDDDAADENEWRSIPSDPVLVAYVLGLPSILDAAHRRDRPRINTGITYEMIDGTYSITDVIVQILVHLSGWFPKNHFGGMPAQRYFSHYLSHRAKWHAALNEPAGPGTSGTILGVQIAYGVLGDMKIATEEVVSALLWGTEGFYWRAWKKAWRKAGTEQQDSKIIDVD
jgi:hypothetical protein